MIVEAPCPQPTSATFAPAFELLLDASERRDPLGHEIGPVAGAEEALGPAKQAVVVLVPAHPVAAAKCLQDAVFVSVERRDQVIDAEDVKRAVFIGQRQRVLVRERVAVAARVVADVTARGLVPQPLTNGALGHTRTLGHLLGFSGPA